MDYKEVIAFLREQDAGRGGEHERVVEYINDLLGQLREAEERAAVYVEDVSEERQRERIGAARWYHNRS